MIIVKLKGGFCNNLFQYSAAKALAINNSDILKIDIGLFKGSPFEDVYRFNYLKINENLASEYEIQKLANKIPQSIFARALKKTRLRSMYNKKTHFVEKNMGLSFDLNFFSLKGDVYLDGWFADEKYFKKIREILIKEFEIKNELRDLSKRVLDKILNSNSVSVHIRRGAFVTNSFFGALPLDYYHRAVSYIEGRIINPHFYVFSDDIDWVRNNLKINGEMTIVDHNSIQASLHHTKYDYEDLTLMKNCKHNIMAHSTFSWWGAWLNQNPNKIVIAPIKALNDPVAQKYYEKSNYIPNNWIKL